MLSPSSTARDLFRWYLRNFPLRDGKTFFYNLLHQRLAPGERFVVARIDRGFLMKLDLADPVQRRMYFYGNYDERYEARMIQRLLEGGESFWDVGANIGYFSLLAAATLGHVGQVIAFEPGSAAYEGLKENIALNPFANITPYKVAVMDRSGEAVLYLSGDLADGCASLFGSKAAEAVSETCRTISLDEFSRQKGLRNPDFIKIDVEGAELFVLRGAENLIAASRPLLLIEMKEATLQASGTTKGEIQQLLQAQGYRAAFPHKRRWYATQDVRQAPSRNILWFNPSIPGHRGKVARLPVIGAY